MQRNILKEKDTGAESGGRSGESFIEREICEQRRREMELAAARRFMNCGGHKSHDDEAASPHAPGHWPHQHRDSDPSHVLADDRSDWTWLAAGVAWW